MRLGLVADVHMRDRDHEAVTAALETAVERIETFDPNRTVVLGDLVQDDDHAHDVRNVERVVETLAPLSPRYLAGNHDIQQLSGEEFEALVGNDRGGHERVAGVDLLFLDTSAPHLPRARSEVPDEQLQLLRDTLADSETALLFSHHLLCYRDISDNPWFGEMPEMAFCSNKVWVQRILDDHDGVVGAFHGHVHENAHARYRGVDHFTVNAVNKELPDSESPTGTHALVELDEERLRVEVFDREGFVRAWEFPRERGD